MTAGETGQLVVRRPVGERVLVLGLGAHQIDDACDRGRSEGDAQGDRDQTIVTLRRIAQIFEEKLGHPEKAIDIHRRHKRLDYR